MASMWMVFALTSLEKVQARTFPKTKAEERTKKEKARKGPVLNPDSQPQKHSMKKKAWESDDWSASHWTDDSWTPDAGWFCTRTYTAWMVATLLNLANHPTRVVDLGCTRSIGSRAAIERFKKHAWHYGITTEFCRCNKSFVFANSGTEACKESCIIHFPTTPPCSTEVDVLETGEVPILFSLSQMKNLGVPQQ